MNSIRIVRVLLQLGISVTFTVHLFSNHLYYRVYSRLTGYHSLHTGGITGSWLVGAAGHIFVNVANMLLLALLVYAFFPSNKSSRQLLILNSGILVFSTVSRGLGHLMSWQTGIDMSVFICKFIAGPQWALLVLVSMYISRKRYLEKKVRYA